MVRAVDGMAVGDKKFEQEMLAMDIESELPEDFDELSDEEKIEELEELRQRIDDSGDAGAVKKRIVEEMIRTYSR